MLKKRTQKFDEVERLLDPPLCCLWWYSEGARKEEIGKKGNSKREKWLRKRQCNFSLEIILLKKREKEI